MKDKLTLKLKTPEIDAKTFMNRVMIVLLSNIVFLMFLSFLSHIFA